MSKISKGQLFEYLMNASKDLIFIKNLNHEYMIVNDAYLKLLNKSMNEFIGQTDKALFSPDKADLYMSSDNLVFDALKPVDFFEWVEDAEGNRCYFETIKSPLFDDQDQLIGLLGFSRDLTHRKETEDRLAEREMYLNGLIDGMEQGLAIHELICDDQGNPMDYRFVEANAKFEQMTGLKRESIIGKTVLEILPQTELYWIETYGRVAQTGKSIQFENQSSALGKIFSVYAFQPKYNHFATLIQDVSEQKAYEENLIRAKWEAENANQIKDQFLTNMSHEIRTPMNGLSGMMDLLQMTPLTDDQKLYLSLMKRSTQTLMQVITEILEYTRLIKGDTTLINEPFQLNHLIDDLVGLYTFSMQHKGLNFTVNRICSLKESFVGDKVKLRQILTILVDNALKFTQQGQITLTIDCKEDKPELYWLQFEVKDTGIGISEETQKIIFNLFEQGDSSDKKHYQGIGLGLTMAKELCDKMNGSIKVSSRLNEGSLFSLQIPLQGGDDLPKKEGSQMAGPVRSSGVERIETRGKSILLVEDDEISSLLVTMILKRGGYNVLCAEDSKKAFDLVDSCEVDLILMDLQLPGIDGFEITERIRNQSPERLRNIPIIAVTAHGTETNRQKSKLVGMDYFLTKPIDKDHLMALVQEWINN